MEILGKIKVLGLDTKVSDKFTKRDVVVTTDEQYPQDISVQFVQDKCELLDAYKVGDDVKIGINLRGREWVNPQGVAVYFNTIQGWNISHVKNPSDPLPNESLKIKQDHSDLPF
jgi:hypothetical protein